LFKLKFPRRYFSGHITGEISKAIYIGMKKYNIRTSVLVKMKLNVRTSIEVFDVIKGPCGHVVSAKLYIHWSTRVGTECCRGQWCQNQTHGPYGRRRTHFFVCLSLWKLVANARVFISTRPCPKTPCSSLFPSLLFILLNLT